MTKKTLFQSLLTTRISLIFYLITLLSFPNFSKAQTAHVVEGRILTPQLNPVENARISFLNISYFTFTVSRVIFDLKGSLAEIIYSELKKVVFPPKPKREYQTGIRIFRDHFRHVF